MVSKRMVPSLPECKANECAGILVNGVKRFRMEWNWVHCMVYSKYWGPVIRYVYGADTILDRIRVWLFCEGDCEIMSEV